MLRTSFLFVFFFKEATIAKIYSALNLKPSDRFTSIAVFLFKVVKLICFNIDLF